MLKSLYNYSTKLLPNPYHRAGLPHRVGKGWASSREAASCQLAINAHVLYSLKHLRQGAWVRLIRWAVLSVRDVNMDFNMFSQKLLQTYIRCRRKRQISINAHMKLHRGLLQVLVHKKQPRLELGGMNQAGGISTQQIYRFVHCMQDTECIQDKVSPWG